MSLSAALALLLDLLAIALFALLLAFALRRVVFTLTLLRPQPPLPEPREWPTVLLLIPAHNEGAILPALFACLDQLDYPRDRFCVTLINDGSTDDTGALMAQAAASRSHWRVLNLPRNVGKARALSLAVSEQAFGEIIYIFDVDHRPQPDCLREAVRAFGDPRVAGVSGRTIPANPYASPSAFYASLESLVHQLVTIRGKDVLNLGPALLGSNNGYRRRALMEVGGFRPGAFLEDSDLTLALYRAGYAVRYAPQAVSTLQVPFTLAGWVRQHIRWGRGFNDVARTHLPALLRDARLSWLMRLELALFSLGYLDRLALLGITGVLMLNAITGRGQAQGLPLLGIALNLGLPMIQIIAALTFDRAPWAMWVRLPLVPLFFMLDAGVAVWSMALTLLNRPRVWGQTERADAG
jgi:cellulose synthase/poly-beta-1,6-N-acetylglucosamine synthase-like glycosyltransferase